MKPLRRAGSVSQSCSCTSCINKSESEQPSIRKYIARGSKISRLYFGKYIPLHERKLLNRLVRTRAVYDDLRARLISDSTLSLEKNADLRPRQHHHRVKPLDSEQSGAILKLVDFIDKGATLGTTSLSECCSCCSCASKENISVGEVKDYRRKRGYVRTYEEEYGQTGQIGKGEGTYARTYDGEYRKYGKAAPGRIGNRYNKIGFKTKRIRSDPCTCTFKFSGLIKKHSKAMIRKLRHTPIEEPYFDTEVPVNENSKKNNFGRKYKDVQVKIGREIKNLQKSTVHLKQNLQLRAKKSLEQVKLAKNKIKNNIESGVHKSIKAVKALNPRDRAFESFEYPELDTDFRIKKDSIAKFKDYLKRKELMKNWECDMECEPDTCVPDECFKIIKLRRLYKRKREKVHKLPARYGMINREFQFSGTALNKSNSLVQPENLAMTTGTRIKQQKLIQYGNNNAAKYDINQEMKLGEIPLSKSNSGVQAGQFAVTTKKQGTNKQKRINQAHKHAATHGLLVVPGSRYRKKGPIIRIEDQNPITGKRLIFKTKNMNKYDAKGVKKTSANGSKSSSLHDSQEENALRIIESKDFTQRKKMSLEKESKTGKQEKSHSPGRQAVRISSSFSFDVEFYKKTPNLSQSSQFSGIHVYKPKHKRHRNREHSEIILKPMASSPSNVPEKPKARLIQTDKYNEQRQLLPDIIHYSNIKTNTNYGTKSVSSLTTRSSTAATINKNISTEVKQRRHSSQASLLPDHNGSSDSRFVDNYSSHKQAVRIGSTFSFNVEFYKKGNRSDVRSVGDKVNQIPTKLHTKNRYNSPKLLKVKKTSAKAHSHTKTKMQRCFCTLKLHGKGKNKKKIKTSTTAPLIIATVPPMIDKYVATNNIYRYKLPKAYPLQPYECEPGVCVPDECDPILCKKILDLRKDKRTSKSVGSYVSSRKTKSTSSIASRPLSFAKTVQSSIVPMKTGKTNVPRRYKQHLSSGIHESNNTHINERGRQAVRIGSSFSFNIEFYKDHQSPADEIISTRSSSTTKGIKYKKRKNKNVGYQEHEKHNKSIFTQVLNRDKNMGSSLKRCFCTLKLYKDKIRKEKRLEKAQKISTNTQTFGKVIMGDIVNKGTKTKKKDHYTLLPYECEPYTCIPGECDPYVCLQTIKRREYNTRDYGVFTDKPEIASATSSTDNLFLKSKGTLIQPKLIPRGTNKRLEYMKPKPTYITESKATLNASKEVKQAVKIGSSFNFSVEFSKQLPGAVKLIKFPKENLKKPPNANHNKGIAVTKVRVNHMDTQALTPKLIHRAALVRPILKRCFCTLNLQKKAKYQYYNGQSKFTSESQHFGPKVYTVGRAITRVMSHSFSFQKKVLHCSNELQIYGRGNKIISMSVSSFLLKKFTNNLNCRCSNIKLYSMSKIPLRIRQFVKIKTNLSLTVEIMRELGLCKKARSCNIKQPLENYSHRSIDDQSHKYIKLFRQTSNQNINKGNGISRYLEQRFCTMNVQISNVMAPQDIKKKNHKLKPYECEPGICIPGECNPYECKKLIMKRFTKNVHKGSGTSYTNKSISSTATTYTGTGSKSTEMHPDVRTHSQKSIPQRYYKLQHRNSPKRRQAVRVGSSLSFNLEFYRTLSQPFGNMSKQEVIRSYIKRTLNNKPYEIVNKGVQENRIKEVASQLNATQTTPVKASGTMTKRCFCTLKLQKKGRIHAEHAKLSTQPTKKPYRISSKNAKIGTTVKYGIPVDVIDLKSYECEPGICIPGQCDPYKCLELMKERRDFGINTARRVNESVSSMASDGYSKRKHKSRAVDAKPKRTHHKTTKANKYIESVTNLSPQSSQRSSRPAVRIGSNFSFNIEFYKDTPQAARYEEAIVRKIKPSRSGNRKINPKKGLNNIGSQNDNSFSHRDIQVDKTYTEVPSITTGNLSFKQRCFCVLGLQKKKKPLERKHIRESKTNKNDQRTKKPLHTTEKFTNTNYRHRVILPRLEPYECEPGICIPGQCNPYLCDKIIQQRMAKQYSRGSETESVRTHSISSSFVNYKQLRNEKTQSQRVHNRNQIQHLSKTAQPSDKIASNSDKRVVRIGSNFSFDIEFYKENGNGNEIEEKTRGLKSYPIKNVQFKTNYKPNMLKNTGTETLKSPGVRSNESQITKKEKRMFGVNPLLKRCFCTLKLMNKPIQQNKKKHKLNIKRTTMKSVETQSNKLPKGPLLLKNLQEIPKILSPYECEPYVCVPGECDPVECLKLINKRRQRTKDFGVVTKDPKRKSIGSVASRMRDENLQYNLPSTISNKSVQKVNLVGEPQALKSSNQSRQAVRIGSNFSFNIEFFKDIGNDTPEVINNKPFEEMDMQRYSKKYSQNHNNADTQLPYLNHNMESQAISTKMQSTETKMAQLKRCFCTLQLQNKNLHEQGNKSIKNKSEKPKSDHASVRNFLKKCVCTLKINKFGKLQNRPLSPAVQYEIKGTSTENRHKYGIKKPIKILEPYECEPYVCVPGECNPYECLKRIQRRQVRDFGTDYKRSLKDSATDSINQPMTRSTKAQYNQRRKLYSRGTSFVSKPSRVSNVPTQHLPHFSHTNDRQVVRIGSNFSFNVEFFKDHGTVNTDGKEVQQLNKHKLEPKIKTRSERIRTKNNGSIGTEKRQICKSSQSLCLIKKRINSSTNTTPKRCFCTLKLLKNSNNSKTKEKQLPPTVMTKNKMTTTKVKYAVPHELGVYECPPLMCIPGECNPYECLDKMKERGIILRFRNAGTKTGRPSISSVGTHPLYQKGYKIQSEAVRTRNTGVYTPCSEPQTKIFKPSRVVRNFDRPNKRAVRIGSNFNFNVEFLKQKSYPGIIHAPKIVKARENEEDSKSYLNKNVAARARNFRHYSSQMDNMKLKDQASDAGNLLKRCFCTLQLQKSGRRKIIQNKAYAPGINVTYPQTYTVQRVMVEPFDKNLKTNVLKKTEKARSTCINPKLCQRTVGTKVNKKYLRNDDFPLSQCNPSNCPDYYKKSFGKYNKSDMKTILPYTPSKFNRKESKTVVKCYENNHPNDTPILDKSKRRLTAKKSKKAIPKNLLREISNENNSFFCRCVKFFTRRSETKPKGSGNQENINNIVKTKEKIYKTEKTHYNDSAQLKFMILPKENQISMRAMVGENCPKVCPRNVSESKKLHSIFQSLDAGKNIMKRSSMKTTDSQLKNQRGEKYTSRHPKMRVTFANSIKNLKNDTHRGKTNKSILSKSSMPSRLCDSCSMNDCPLKSKKLKNDHHKLHNFHIFGKNTLKSNNNLISYSESADDCQYCECCKRKIDIDEISKGGGDRQSTVTSHYKDNTDRCPCYKDSVSNNQKEQSQYEEPRVDKVSKKYISKVDKCCIKNKPLFEMQIDSVNYGIINKGQVMQKVNQLSTNNNEIRTDLSNQIKTKHGHLCRCCKCVGKTKINGAKLSVPAKGPNNLMGAIGKIFSSKKSVSKKSQRRRKSISPCVCGSKKCAIELKRYYSGKPKIEKVKRGKKCLCGSNICRKESKKIKKLRDMAASKSKRKARSVQYTKEMKEVYRRLYIEREKDEIRRLKRIKRNRELENRVKKMKDASDATLAVDSLIDVGKLGVSTVCGALRYTAKSILDPRVTCEKCKMCLRKDPAALSEALKRLQKDYVESDAAATAKRLKLRCTSMKRVQLLRQKLEENPVTHFILHAADKNPKTRKFKRKPVKRVRPPLDFQCSLYMASLRRRPHLAVYYKCPWFYPHFITMLNIWKQFTDIMLFLLAAVVWSPCILCMEGCRACLCCFFCTG